MFKAGASRELGPGQALGTNDLRVEVGQKLVDGDLFKEVCQYGWTALNVQGLELLVCEAGQDLIP